jgi:hypothetical protein
LDTALAKDGSEVPAPLLDVQTLRARARQHIEQGAVMPGYAGEREAEDLSSLLQPAAL